MPALKVQHETIGHGPSVVLVPGGLTGWISWQPFATALADEHRVTRTQLLAVQYGLENKSLPDGYTLSTESSALARTLDELRFDVFDLAGWSYGALTSLDYALNHPHRIRTLTLIEPPAMWVLRSRGPLSPALEQERPMISQLGPGPISEDQLVWFSHFAGFVTPEVDPRTLPPWPIWMKHRQSLRTQDAVYRHQDAIERVRQFQPPVWLLKGTGSSPWLHDIIDILADEFPHAHVTELSGGHAPHLANQQQWLGLFREFLAKRK